MGAIELLEVPPCDTAVVREVVARDQLPAFFAWAFHEVAEALEAQGLAPSGEPFALYLSPPGRTLDIEAGFPVLSAVREEGEMFQSQLPGGPVAKAVHLGRYDTRGDTWGALSEWIARRGLRPGALLWEVYRSEGGPSRDPRRWRTEVYWPVEGALKQ